MLGIQEEKMAREKQISASMAERGIGDGLYP